MLSIDYVQMDVVETEDGAQPTELSSQTWTVERDVFGNIQRWEDMELEIGAWDTIQSHTQGKEKLELWHRDSAGRLTAIESNEDRMILNMMVRHEPVRWSKGDRVLPLNEITGDG